MTIYRSYDQAQLDAQYNNRAMVPDFADFLARGTEASEQARRNLNCALDQSYGSGARQRLDIFPAAESGAPIHLFIHGGYWRALDKEDFCYPAPAFVEAGITFIAIEYPLAPRATMDEIVDSVRAACAWVGRNAQRFDGDPRLITVSGHSAGGHLAAMMLATDWTAFSDGEEPLPADFLRGACAISGLYDLEPIRLCYLNSDVRLDPEMALRNSPIHQSPKRAGPLILTVGALESDEYHRQQDALASAWQAAGLEVQAMDLEGLHHFSIVERLADPESPLFQTIRGQISKLERV